MPINEANIIGLFFFACLACIALWRIYAKWRSYRNSHTPTIGEMLPIRVSLDGFHDYPLDLQQLQSRPTSITKKPQVLKGSKDYDTVFDNKEEYTMPEASYPLQMSERKSQQNEST